MTENKRFTITQDFEEHHRQIRDNGHIIMGCFVEPQAEVIVNLLNELHDENKELKKENEQLKDALNQRTDQCDKYYKENEQLKFQNSNLMKEVAEYSRKAKELEKGDGTTRINISQNKRCGDCAYFVRIYDGFCDLKKTLVNPSICSCDYWTTERIPNLNR